MKMVMKMNILFLLKLIISYAVAITSFSEKKDIKVSFGFDDNINTEHLQHWVQDGKVSASPITFEPPFLDFPETPIGQPKWDNVKIVNEDETMSIYLYSISSSSVDFHCSLFKEEILPGQGNSSFDVVFLSQRLGTVQNTLFIHTSRGTFNYQVSGYGVPSPYRIKSFHKAKIPLYSSFISPIYFYNPYEYPIQILEMYTSGGNAHLELPNQSKESSKKLWIVPPYETRTIMRVKFIGNEVGNFTSFIRIRTNITDNSFGFVIPLQIEISNKSNLYCISDIIYFGILRSLDSPKSIKLTVINSANESIRIKNISLQKPNEAVNIDFQQVNVMPGIHRQLPIASITFSAFKVTSVDQSSGNIVIKTFNNQTLIVPYLADVIHGSLVYDANNTKFFTESTKSSSDTRHIALTNTFDFTIAIYSISLPTKANCCFKLSNLTFPIYIKSKETESAIKMEYFFKNVESFVTQIAIFSNISLFVIPIFVYNGKLTVVSHRPEIYKGHFDFGTLGLKSEEYFHFTVKNENPTEVMIFSMMTNWFLASIMLMGVEKGNHTILQRNITHKPTLNFLPLILKPYHFSVFRLKIITPDTQGVFASDISIVTQYEKLSIPYYLRTTDGVISTSDSLVLRNCFPSKTSRIMMTLNSSFQSYTELTSVKFIPNDTRFSFDIRSGRNLPILIKPLETTTVGYIKFSFGNNCVDPFADEFFEFDKNTVFNDKRDVSSTIIQFKILAEMNGKMPCYVGFSACTKLGYQWLLATDMNSKTYLIDKFIYKRIHQQWEAFRTIENHPFNVTMQMDTSNEKGFLSNVQAQFVWPNILSGTSKTVKFPLTQIGNFSFRDIYLENPSDNSILLQLILISHYYDPYSLIELLGISDKDVDISKSNIFTLHPSKLDEEKHVYLETMKENNKIMSMMSIIPHNESITILLLPKSKQKTRVYFNPNHDTVGKRMSTILVLRNNLTSLETVWLEGEGIYGELLFQSGHLQEETSILHFELTEKHLKSCDSQPKGIIPSFTVRRPFVIKNIGKIPVYIIGFQFGPLLNININDNQASNEFQGNDTTTTFPTILENVKSDVENKGDNAWCAGYGFEILECYSYRLNINETLKLEIVFTPDFSLHKVIQQLQVYTSLSDWPFNITVQASLPAHMLHRCSQALARPDSEVLIWYMAIVVLSIVTIAAIIMSYYEADRIFTSNVIYRHLSSVAIGNYHHPISDRICDFRTFSKNSFLNSSNPIPLTSKSSVHDYLSIYNRNECDSTILKRVNICKKHDEKLPFGLTEKLFSQSFCGKSISEDINGNDHGSSTLISSSIHQHKKKKKRGIIFGIIQWIMRSFTQIINQNTALKPRLEDNFNYKTEGQPFTKSKIFNNSKIDDLKNESSNKSLNFNKNKVICCNPEVPITTNLTQNNISNNNNSNQPSHSKKAKIRSNCTSFSNQTKFNPIKQQETTIATLNFAPIDIPALDSHKLKKNCIINKKQKKNVQVSSEDLKNKSTLRLDDSLSMSTDSSAEEKIKDVEVDRKSKTHKSKQDLPKSCSVCLQNCNDSNSKQNIYIDFDEDCSIKSNDSGIESSKNKNNVRQIKSNPENSFRNNENQFIKKLNQNHACRSSFDRKENVHSSIGKCNASSVNAGVNFLNNKKYNSCGFSMIGDLNAGKDFSILSERTKQFSNLIDFHNNADDLFNEPSRSNIEHWLCSASNVSANNMKPIEIFDEENQLISPNYTNKHSENTVNQIDLNYQMLNCASKINLCNPSDQTLGNYFKQPCITSFNSENSQYKDIENTTIYKSKFNQLDLFNNDIVPLHNPNNFISLELPGIAHGRKQSLLEYERRTQKDPIDCEWLSKNPNVKQCPNNYLPETSSFDSYWNENAKSEIPLNNKIWNICNDLSNSQETAGDNSLWTVEKSWNQIEPGSQYDHMARTLLPIGLLTNESSNVLFSNPPENLWKFKPEDKSNSMPNSCK